MNANFNFSVKKRTLIAPWHLPPHPASGRARGVVRNASESGWANWPMLTHKDYALVGSIVVLYSYMDLNLRRIAETADRVGMLKPPWKGKTAKLTIDHTETAVLSLDWSQENIGALQKIRKLRGLRNMLAHFVLRRFPSEAAFVCVAISARDYERQLGIKPEKGALLTAVLDLDQINQAVKHIEHVQLWLAKVTSQYELMVSEK